MKSTKDNTEATENLRISNSELNLTIRVFDGKDGDFFILFSPSLNISGYGLSKKDAEESFKTSIEAFALDIKELSTKKREAALTKLGWHKEKLKQKNYSHAFIDKEGILQNLGLELEQLKESEMMLTV